MADWQELAATTQQRANPSWTSERERAVRRRIDHALNGRRVARATASVVAAVAGLALLVGGARHFLRDEPAPLAAPARGQSAKPALLMSFEDGSTVLGLSPEARVTALAVDESAATLRLESGEARFEVTPDPERRFRVLAQRAEISVLGTAFRVAVSKAGVQVHVERGRVAVACAGERNEIGPGRSASCPRVPEAPQAPAASAESAAPPSSTASNAPARPRAPLSWRTLAQEGEYGAAYGRMIAEGSSAVRDEPADLLFAADVARLSGHPNDAVARLERVLRVHASDSRAALAAFTLGRTLLDDLGRPREAADAFARARRLSPSGALAQDALAREVESWSRAGEPGLAKERAKHYLQRYPTGRRVKAVRHHGGIE